jgi:mannose/fructose/N-acetylgalactosamine-specific phosphotransferase system component IIB
MAVTPDIEVEFVTVAQASAGLRDWQSDARRTLVLTGDLATMAALHDADPVTVHRINLGGIHHKAGRRERLPYLYLTDEEMARLEALEASGAAISAQDLPTTAPVSLKALG